MNKQNKLIRIMTTSICIKTLRKNINHANTLCRLLKLNYKIEMSNDVVKTQDQLMQLYKHPYIVHFRPNYYSYKKNTE